ncbi:hypothetical protein [Cellulomonas pakistanensis]|uniref:EF-hand domain-containing protein n=1 Tax=Cellulomonas pakistanensis TaxID=992287 RepID=A0A919PED3_9CELL|nr:hypothetical protein [Cellulomonas pakistanensis]GIG38131.1 hypothetical protein Cpa01nite_35120 [Cellulomonas pakistanensis]
MGGFLVVIGLALVAAIGVIVLANAASGGGTDVRTFWADLKRGLRRRDGDEADLADVEEPEPVDVPFDRFFAEAPQAGDGYLQLDELADMLERTGERAGRLRERLPSSRGGGETPARPDAAPARVVVQDRVPAPAAARRSGHLPVRRPDASAGVPGADVAAPPAVPPQRTAS